jgi:hypothetical protein
MVAMVVRTILSRKQVPGNYTQLSVAMYLRSLGIRAQEAGRIVSMPLDIPSFAADATAAGGRKSLFRTAQ